MYWCIRLRVGDIVAGSYAGVRAVRLEGDKLELTEDDA